MCLKQHVQVCPLHRYYHEHLMLIFLFWKCMPFECVMTASFGQVFDLSLASISPVLHYNEKIHAPLHRHISVIMYEVFLHVYDVTNIVSVKTNNVIVNLNNGTTNTASRWSLSIDERLCETLWSSLFCAMANTSAQLFGCCSNTRSFSRNNKTFDI